MLDFTLTGEEAQIRETVRSFVTREVMPYEHVLIQREIDGGHGASPGLSSGERRALQAKGKEMGLWGIDTPEEYGGADLSPVAQALIHEELGKTIVDFEFGGSVIPTLYACDSWQKDTYLVPTINGDRPPPCIAISEPDAGSDVRSMKTTALRDGGEWILSGEKTWITHAPYADYAIVLARTPDETGPDGMTCFLVDRDMGWKSSVIPLMGCRDKVGSLHFSDIRVPGRNVLGEVNKGLELAMGFIYRNRAYIISAKNVGTAERLLSMAIEWSKDRVVFGKALSTRENVAFAIAAADIEIRAAKLLVYHGAVKAARGEDYRHEAYAAKVYVAQMVNRVVDSVLQIHGAIGYAKENPIERWYRDLRIERIYDGSDEVNLAGLARNLFKGTVAVGGIF